MNMFISILIYFGKKCVEPKNIFSCVKEMKLIRKMITCVTFYN